MNKYNTFFKIKKMMMKYQILNDSKYSKKINNFSKLIKIIYRINNRKTQT